MILTRIFVEEFLKKHDFAFQPNQQKLCYPKLERIYNRMALSKNFPPIKYGNGKIIEGHHRYICSEILSIDIDFIKGGVNLSFENDYFWKDILIENNEWDSDAKLEDYKIEFDL